MCACVCVCVCVCACARVRVLIGQGNKIIVRLSLAILKLSEKQILEAESHSDVRDAVNKTFEVEFNRILKVARLFVRFVRFDCSGYAESNGLLAESEEAAGDATDCAH
jgi:hypothetical protein